MIYFTELVTTLIISDSIAKYIKVKGAEVYAIKGAHIGEISYQLEKHKGSISYFKKLIIHVGTNDINYLSEKDIKSAFCNLISLAKSLFPSTKIGISAILPRPVDFNWTKEIVTKVNSDLSDLCLRFGVQYLQSYRYFIRFGKPIIEYFAYKDGGLHLNHEGSRLLGLYLERKLAHF